MDVLEGLLGEHAGLVKRDQDARDKGQLDAMDVRVPAAATGTKFAMSACVNPESGKLNVEGEWVPAVFVTETGGLGTLAFGQCKFQVTLPDFEDDDANEDDDSRPSLFEDLWYSTVRAQVELRVEVEPAAIETVEAEVEAAVEAAVEPAPKPEVGRRVALISDATQKGFFFSLATQHAIVCWDDLSVTRVDVDLLRALTDEETEREKEVDTVLFVAGIVKQQDPAKSEISLLPWLLMMGPIYFYEESHWRVFRGCAPFPQSDLVQSLPPPFDFCDVTVGVDNQVWAQVQLPVVYVNEKTSRLVSEFLAQIVCPVHGQIWNDTRGAWEFCRYMLLLEPDAGPIIARMENLTLLDSTPDGMTPFTVADLQKALVPSPPTPRSQYAMIEMSCVVQEDLGKVPSKTIKRRMDREVLGADTNLRLRDTGGFNGGPNDELKIDTSCLDGIGESRLTEHSLEDLQLLAKRIGVQPPATTFECVVLFMELKRQAHNHTCHVTCLRNHDTPNVCIVCTEAQH